MHAQPSLCHDANKPQATQSPTHATHRLCTTHITRAWIHYPTTHMSQHQVHRSTKITCPTPCGTKPICDSCETHNMHTPTHARKPLHSVRVPIHKHYACTCELNTLRQVTNNGGAMSTTPTSCSTQQNSPCISLQNPTCT